MKRDIVDAIILNLIPLFVVALLLFAQMMTVTSDKKLNDKFGFNTSGAIATASALFFIVLLAHIQVRQHLLTVENESGPYGYSEEEQKNENAIEYYLENFYAERVFIKNDDLVDGIMTFASKRDLDLIAILPRHHTKYTEPSEGQLTQMLVLHSKVPVLAID